MYKRLRDLRKRYNKKQWNIAQYLYVTQAAYSRYENGTVDIPTDKLVELAQLYNTSTDYLSNMTDALASNKADK